MTPTAHPTGPDCPRSICDDCEYDDVCVGCRIGRDERECNEEMLARGEEGREEGEE